MSLVVGSVTVDDAGNRTGSGAALVVYDAQIASMASFLGQISADKQVELKRGVASFSGAIASLVGYIKDNAEVSVTIATTDVGLQTTPNPNNPNTATLGPTADKTLSGTLT